MTRRPAIVLVSTLVLAVVAGVVVLLVADRGPDPDAAGYTEGSTRWVRPLETSGTQPIDAGILADGREACLRWTWTGRFDADVAWRGSRADAEVALSSPRMTSAGFSGRLTRTCDSEETLPSGTGLYAVVGSWEVGGDDDTTCGWQLGRGARRPGSGTWCDDEDQQVRRVRQRVEVEDGANAWGFDLSGNPLVDWGGEAGADAGGADPFDDPLCLGGSLAHGLLTSSRDSAVSTGLRPQRFPVCVDLWEATPWGEADAS